MQAFKTLLLREWMQHRVGWLVLAGLPLLPALLLALPFGTVQQFGNTPADTVAAIAAGVVTLSAGLLVWLSVGLQSPGLARRDAQDRSIEFWRSLPTPDSTALAATLVAHLLLLPLVVMCLAAPAGLLAGVLLVARGQGLQSLNLPYLFDMFLAGLPRVLLGSLLASLWASAIVLPMMAASAWLKRWGAPALIGLVSLGGLLLEKYYEQTWLRDAVRELFTNFAAALLPLSQGFESRPAHSAVPAWFWEDAQRRLHDLATPQFALALLLAATGFGLLLLRRRRG